MSRALTPPRLPPRPPLVCAEGGLLFPGERSARGRRPHKPGTGADRGPLPNAVPCATVHPNNVNATPHRGLHHLHATGQPRLLKRVRRAEDTTLCHACLRPCVFLCASLLSRIRVATQHPLSPTALQHILVTTAPHTDPTRPNIYEPHPTWAASHRMYA